jgi:hypothetical protein
MNTTMNDRSPWPAWAATAIAVLGLAGLAAAQNGSYASAEDLLTILGPDQDQYHTEPGRDPVPPIRPISDDGRSTDLLPVVNELIINRSAESTAPIDVRILDEHGRLVDTLTLGRNTHRALPIGLQALAAGRYVAQISGTRQVGSVRFRKP